MRIIVIAFVFAILLGSCASLTKTQVHAVNQFARTSKNFSAYPGRIIAQLAEVRVMRGVYFSNSLDDPQLHLEDLDGIYIAHGTDYEVSNKVDITFKVIDKYAQSLLLLSSDEYATDLQEQAGNFGTGLDSLTQVYNALPNVQQVPTGIGAAIGELINLGGRQYIRSKQATEIRKFVTLGDTLVSVMCGNLLEFLQSSIIHDLILNEEKGVSSNYLSFLRQRHPTIQNERDYLDMKAGVDLARKLRDKTISATKNLRKAHKKLFTIVQEKKTLNESVSELQALYEDVKDLKSTIDTIEYPKPRNNG